MRNKKIFSLLLPCLTAMSLQGCPMGTVYLEQSSLKTMIGEEAQIAFQVDVAPCFERQKLLLGLQIDDGDMIHMPLQSGRQVLTYTPTKLVNDYPLPIHVTNLIDPSLNQTYILQLTTERVDFKALGSVDTLGKITLDIQPQKPEHQEILSKRRFKIVLPQNAFTNAQGKVLYTNLPNKHDGLSITKVRNVLKVADLRLVQQNMHQSQQQVHLPTLKILLIDLKDQDNQQEVCIDLRPMVRAKIDQQVMECTHKSQEIEQNLQKLNDMISKPGCFANLNDFDLFKKRVLNLASANQNLVQTELKLYTTYTSLDNQQDAAETQLSSNRPITKENTQYQRLLAPLLEMISTEKYLNNFPNATSPNLDNILGTVQHLGCVALSPTVIYAPVDKLNLLRLKYYLLFKDAQLQPDSRSCAHEWTPLMFAAKIGDVKTMKMLLDHPKLDINATDHNGLSALHVACLYYIPQCRQTGNVDMLEGIRLLLSHKDIQVNKLTTTQEPSTALDALYERQTWSVNDKPLEKKEFNQVKELLISNGANYHKYAWI